MCPDDRAEAGRGASCERCVRSDWRAELCLDEQRPTEDWLLVFVLGWFYVLVYTVVSLTS